MSRRTLGSVAVLLAVLPASAIASADPAHAPASRSTLKPVVCTPSRQRMSVTAVMRPVAGTSRLEMRFELLRGGGGSSAALAGRKLNTWLSPSNPSLGQRMGDRWIVHHPVEGLAARHSYRFKVFFRWLDSHGSVIARRHRLSGSCLQPGPVVDPPGASGIPAQ